MTLDGKVVLITGASEGIGAACVEVFRRRGARLALAARSHEKLRALAGPDMIAVPGDLTRDEDRRRMVETTLSHFGSVDVLVNNAGVGLYAPAPDATMAQTRAMFELNFFAPLEMARLVIPSMRLRKRGLIVNVGSIAGKITLPWLTLYSASKSALGALTDGLRLELRRDGIHTMTVCPGYVDTGFQRNAMGGGPPAALRGARPLSVTVRQCAEAIVRGVERDARTVMTPTAGWLAVAAAGLFPRWMDARLERIYEKG